MSSRSWFVLLAFLGITSPARGDDVDASAPPRNQTSPRLLEATREAEFAGWVQEGDEARKAGKPGRAANAYAKALAVHDDPVVAGRLGVLLVSLKKPAEAVDLLLAGIQRGFLGVDKEERRLFVESYESARAQVTWVNVKVSHADATVTLDGKKKEKENFTAFSIFVLPGEHEIKATLPGYKPAIAEFKATAGGEMTVDLVLVALPGTPVEEPPQILRRRTLERNEGAPAVRDLELPPDEDEPEKKTIYGGVEGAAKPDKPRVSVGVGPVVVFGVASWQPAVGAVAEVRWRPKEYFSLGVEGRAAWLTSGIEGRQIGAMTAGGLASVCGHWRWLFGCGLGYVGTVNVEFTNRSYNEKSYALTQPGGGARLGVLTRFGSSFVLQINADALILSRGMTIIAGQTTLVQQGPFMFDTQLLGGWEF